MNSATSCNETRWKIPQLIFCHFLVLLFVSTFLWPLTEGFWKSLDIAFFKGINSSLIDHPSLQFFWACANHRYADWVEDIFILGFFILHIKSFKKGTQIRGIAQFVFCALYVAAIIYFVNRVIFRENFVIYRDSPSIVIDETFRLSDVISWMRIKVDSTKCFPGDHATTAILFSACYTFYAKKRFAILAILYGVFLCMPRMIVGAHWLSDVLIGSGSIALITLSWAFCTPFHLICIRKLESFFTFFMKFKKIKNPT